MKPKDAELSSSFNQEPNNSTERQVGQGEPEDAKLGESSS